MATPILKVTVLWLSVTVCLALELTSTVTTPLLIKQHGYPVEEHEVTTTDGYILTMHRIPYSPKLNNTDNSRRPVAFLMHCNLCASGIWVLTGPGRSLGYILSDAGFDVWLGNARGNVYSKNHVSLSPLDEAFWNFGWHEIGIYDTPAMIDYVLSMTGEKQVRYFGHSQGTTTYMVLNTMIPSYKNRIRSAHLFGPIVYINNAQSLILKASAPLLGQPNPFPTNAEFLPNTRANQLLGEASCKDSDLTQDQCANFIFTNFGGVSPFLNRTMLPEIFSIFPAGSSLQEGIHYLQLYNSKKFRQFDYGSRNLIIYGNISPPEYNLKNLDVPTYLYHSDNDILSSVADVNRLVDALNETKSIKGVYRVPYPEWNHLDFLYGIGVENIVYNVVMKDIAIS